MKIKKTIGVLVILAFLLTLLPGIVLAEEVVAESQIKSGAEAKISLEEAVKIAKKHFQISNDFDVFRSSYSEYDRNKSWQLNWFDQKGELGQLSVAINSETGEVMSYYYYNPKEQEQPDVQGYLPKLTREEAEKIALEHFVRLTNKKKSEISLMPNEEPVLRKGTKYYDFNFFRLVNGVAYRMNTVTITINADTGELQNFFYSWDSSGSFPNERNISQKDAAELIKKELDMELAYFKGYERSGKKPIQLVYQTKNAARVMIDAATGQVLAGPDNYYYAKEERKMMELESVSNAGLELSPVEQDELEKMAGLLSMEDALAIAAKKMSIPAEYVLKDKRLAIDWEFPELIIWHFYWQLEGREKRGWISVELDAKTGKIISFSIDEYDERGVDYIAPENYQIKGKEAALEFAQKYIAANYPEIKDKVRLEEVPQNIIFLEEEKPQQSYWFRFTRLVNGIPFDKNYLNLTVDAAKGQINNMNSRWVELEFPQAGQEISLEKMKNDFLAENQVQLEYIKKIDYKKGRQVDEVYLVYKIANVKATLFDAQTGAKLNYNGEVITEKSQVEFTDIQGHWAEQDIKLLNEYKLLDFPGPKFFPDQRITQGELIKIFVKLDNPWFNEPGIDPMYLQAMRRGVVKEGEKAPEQAVSKEDLALMLVRFLGHEEVSKLDIFKLDFKDADLIAADKKGALAIVHGFGFMAGDQKGNIMPQKEITRAEAVTVLARMLQK